MADELDRALRTPEINRGYEELISDLLGTAACLGMGLYEAVTITPNSSPARVGAAVLGFIAGAWLGGRTLSDLDQIHDLEQSELRRASFQ